MSSRIEQKINEIEEYLDNCKYIMLSKENVAVNKEEIMDLVEELKKAVPDDVKRYQKIVSNKEAILNDAKQKAQELIDATAIQTEKLVSEHEIMQQAYAEANKIIETATAQAQSILDNATMEANEVKASAMSYTDSILANVETILTRTIQQSTNDYNQLISDLSHVENIVSSNRAELAPPQVVPEEDTAPKETEV